MKPVGELPRYSLCLLHILTWPWRLVTRVALLEFCQRYDLEQVMELPHASVSLSVKLG